MSDEEGFGDYEDYGEAEPGLGADEAPASEAEEEPEVAEAEAEGSEPEEGPGGLVGEAGEAGETEAEDDEGATGEASEAGEGEAGEAGEGEGEAGEAGDAGEVSEAGEAGAPPQKAPEAKGAEPRPAALRARPARPRPDPLLRASNRPCAVHVVPEDERETSDRLSRAEVGYVIGMRAQQIAEHAAVFIECDGVHDPVELAFREFFARRCPLIIRRRVAVDPATGNQLVEDWKVREMAFPVLSAPGSHGPARPSRPPG